MKGDVCNFSALVPTQQMCVSKSRTAPRTTLVQDVLGKTAGFSGNSSGLLKVPLWFIQDPTGPFLFYKLTPVLGGRGGQHNCLPVRKLATPVSI